MDSRETLWKALGTVAAIAAAALVRNAATAAWKRTRNADPPANPASPYTRWSEAIAWAALTGMLVGIARMLASRGAAEGWRRATGVYPPGLDEVA
ncbi:MAG: DUF4235 domain-containing protein [Actinobacteria bacterium]|nr:DUF4235 domain-containing protein [Actinomycetota bacterium]